MTKLDSCPSHLASISGQSFFFGQKGQRPLFHLNALFAEHLPSTPIDSSTASKTCNLMYLCRNLWAIRLQITHRHCNTCNWMNHPPQKKHFVYLFQLSPGFQPCLCKALDTVTQDGKFSLSAVQSCCCSIYVYLSTVCTERDIKMVCWFSLFWMCNARFLAYMPLLCSPLLWYTSVKGGASIGTDS